MKKKKKSSITKLEKNKQVHTKIMLLLEVTLCHSSWSKKEQNSINLLCILLFYHFENTFLAAGSNDQVYNKY